jgi:MFS family permease
MSAVRESTAAARGFGRRTTFAALWSGQMVSLVGSVLMEFALGVWIFQRTHSATQFALFNMFVLLPQIVVMPFGGVLADRHPRRTMMLFANAGGIAGTLALIPLYAAGGLRVWSAYLLALAFASFAAVLMPSYLTAVPLLVPDTQLGRANGLVQFAASVSQLVAPIAGGFLVITLGVGGVAALDLITFAIAIGLLVPSAIPDTREGGVRRHILHEVTDGLGYIRSRPGLLGLLLYIACFNVAGGASLALTTPLVLGSGSPRDLGLIAACGGAGLICGALGLAVWAGPRRRVNAILGAGLVLGLVMLMPVVDQSVPVLAVWTFIQYVCLSVGVVTTMTLWQRIVPDRLRGRVIGSLRTVSYTALVLATVAAGALADHVFEPAMAPSGALAGTVGRLVGVGPGRGIVVLLVLFGAVPVIGAVVGHRSPRIRRVEDEEYA